MTSSPAGQGSPRKAAASLKILGVNRVVTDALQRMVVGRNASRSAVQVSRDVLGDLLTYPDGYKLRDLARVEFGRVYPMGHPQFLLIHSS